MEEINFVCKCVLYVYEEWVKGWRLFFKKQYFHKECLEQLTCNVSNAWSW